MGQDRVQGAQQGSAAITGGPAAVGSLSGSNGDSGMERAEMDRGVGGLFWL